MPQLNLDWFRPPFGKKYYHSFLLFAVAEEKFGHHTVLVLHKPKGVFRKVLAMFGRMEKEIADAELLGEMLMKRPYQWDELEEQAKRARSSQIPPFGSDAGLFRELQQQFARDLRDGDVAAVAVYLVRVKTNRENLLYDGQKSSLPKGYLTFYTGRAAA